MMKGIKTMKLFQAIIFTSKEEEISVYLKKS